MPVFHAKSKKEAAGTEFRFCICTNKRAQKILGFQQKTFLKHINQTWSNGGKCACGGGNLSLKCLCRVLNILTATGYVWAIVSHSKCYLGGTASSSPTDFHAPPHTHTHSEPHLNAVAITHNFPYFHHTVFPSKHLAFFHFIPFE